MTIKTIATHILTEQMREAYNDAWRHNDGAGNDWWHDAIIALLEAAPAVEPAPVECEPVGVFMGKRETPENTTEFWGMLSSLNDIPTVGTKLYTAPPQGIYAETRAMVLELLTVLDYAMFEFADTEQKVRELKNKIRERIRS